MKLAATLLALGALALGGWLLHSGPSTPTAVAAASPAVEPEAAADSDRSGPAVGAKGAETRTKATEPRVERLASIPAFRVQPWPDEGLTVVVTRPDGSPAGDAFVSVLVLSPDLGG